MEKQPPLTVSYHVEVILRSDLASGLFEHCIKAYEGIGFGTDSHYVKVGFDPVSITLTLKSLQLLRPGLSCQVVSAAISPLWMLDSTVAL